MFVGDGIDAYEQMIAALSSESLFAERPVRYQRASSVCALGYQKSLMGDVVEYHQVEANYIRPSQAEGRKREV